MPRRIGRAIGRDRAVLTPSRASLYGCGLMFALPFLLPYHRFPLTSFYSEWLAFALGLLAALLLLRRSSGATAEIPVIALAPAGLILLLLIQAMLGRVPYPEQALIAALYLLWASLLVALGTRLRQELGMGRIVDTLAWFTLAGGMLNALAGIIQHYDLTVPAGFLVAQKAGAAVFGNLGQPNHYAAYIAMALASAAYLYGRRHFGVVVAITFVSVLLFVAALAGSRSPWLYFTAFLILSMLIHRYWRCDETRRLLAFSALLLPGFLVAQGVAELFPPPGGEQVTSLQRVFASASGVAARIALWDDAWRMFLAAPLIGSGWGQFPWHHFLHQASSGPGAAPGLFKHAHNLALHLLAETGIIGFAIVFGAAVVWLANLRTIAMDAAWWWVLAVLSIVGLHSMLEYPLWYSNFLGPVALLLGLGSNRTLHVRAPGALRLGVAVCVLAGLLNLYGVLAPYRAFERVLFRPGDNTGAPVEEKVFMAAIARAHNEPLLTPYAELAIAYGIVPSRENLVEKIDLARRAVRFAPVEVVIYRLAILSALAGDRAAALEQLRWARRAYPAALGEVISQLQVLAREYPAEMTPLLELASAKRAQIRTPAAK